MNLLEVFNNIIANYELQGYNVAVIHIDGEKGINTIKTDLLNKTIHLDICGSGQHVTITENKIRQLKDRCHGILHSLNFKLPTSLYIYLF